MAFLKWLLYFVVLFLVMMVVSFFGRKYVFSKIRINKFIPLTISIVLLLIQMFLPTIMGKAVNIWITMVLAILAVTFFIWFMDIQTTGGPKKKEKEIVIRPKAKPNRVKHLNKDNK